MTDKQNAFIAEYLINGFNATQAAIKAGYAETSARTEGSRLLANDNIRKEVQKHIDSTLNAKKDVLKAQIVDELSLIAFDEEGVEKKYNKDGELIGIALGNKVKAIELLGKYMTMWNEKQDQNITNIIYLDRDADAKGF